MNIKKTQQFLYFQNKARHYDALHKIKPVVKSHSRSPSHKRIQNPEHHHRTPYMKKYDIIHANESLVERIIQIRNSQKTQIYNQGYTRYNGFEKKFNDNWKESEKYRTIDRENQRNRSVLEKIKPSVGTLSDWRDSFEDFESRKKIVTKNKDYKSRKLMLMNSKDKFIPEHYVKLREREKSITHIDQQKHRRQSISVIDDINNFNWQQIIKDKSGDLRI